MYFFISHSSENAETAQQICEFLERNHVKCFIAPRDIGAGKEYAEEIINGIDRSSAMVLVMSKEANNSPHVLREVERAVSKNVPILVYKLEEVELSKSMEYFLMAHQWVSRKSPGDYSDILKFAEKLDEKEGGGASGRTAAAVNRENGAGTQRFKWIWAAGAALVVILVFLGLNGADSFSIKKNTVEAEDSLVRVGDTITLGRYNDEPIEWRVLHIEEQNGEKRAVLVSKYILTMKAFDAAEGGKYLWDVKADSLTKKEQVQAWGDNEWSRSNIRTWLNAEMELVTYTDQTPVAAAMSEGHNAYQNEAGFLYHFTKEEREMLVEREVHTPGNVLSQEEDIVTRDKVFLLSKEELDWFDEAGMSKLTEPTEAAREQDKSNWYKIYEFQYEVKEFCWWLRTPVEASSYKAYMVQNGYGLESDEISDNLGKACVGLEGYGIRPAVTVRLKDLSR